MNCKTEQKRRGGWRAWIVPVVVSVAVFVVLGLAHAISASLAIMVAAGIIGGGIILLRSL